MINERITGASSVGDDRIFRNGMTENDSVKETNKVVVCNWNQPAKEKRPKGKKNTPYTTTPTSLNYNLCISTEGENNDTFKENINVKTEKERSKRVITETKRWTFSKEELAYVSQMELLNTLVSLINRETLTEKMQLSPSQRMVYSQVKTKLRSYKEQDLKKNKYDSLKFVTPAFILNKLEESAMICFYCKESTNILYEYVREPKQWTIERLDNTYGHNSDNVVIACLSCNLRRRTSQFERYLTTKKICAGIKKLDEIADI
jgi:aspartate carbamoyltransferase regulatory subunit